MQYPAFLALTLSLALTCVSPCFGEEEGEDSQIPINQRVTAEAWSALSAGDNRAAIEKSNECIERFGKSADTMQFILERQKAVLPTGDVSAEERGSVDRYQILHDLATCYLIRAWAEERLGRKNEAIADYKQVRHYTYARIKKQPAGSYWSPAEVAAQELERLSP